MPSPLTAKQCTECGRTWETRKPSARTCSPRCRAVLRERETPSPGRPQREYPPEVVQQVQAMYAAGHTTKEIGEAIGPGYKAQALVERFVDERRQAAKRDQAGEANHMWKGDKAKYQALHLRVEAARGKPKRCSCCDATDPDARYEWANLSGAYDDINDYARLCVFCHRRLDARRRNQLGRRTSPQRGGEGDV